MQKPLFYVMDQKTIDGGKFDFLLGHLGFDGEKIQIGILKC